MYFIFFLFVLTGSSLFATNRYVVEVLEEGSQIKMDDGFIWDVPSKKEFFGYVLSDYPSETRTWMPGDEVELSFENIGMVSRRILFHLLNLRTSQNVQVTYSEQHEDFFSPRIIDIHSSGYQIFWSLKHQILLSDGTCWEVNDDISSSNFAHFEIGDRISVYPSQNGEFVLVNPDLEFKCNWADNYYYHYSGAYAKPSEE